MLERPLERGSPGPFVRVVVGVFDPSTSAISGFSSSGKNIPSSVAGPVRVEAEDRRVGTAVHVADPPGMLLDRLQDPALEGSDAIVLGDVRVLVDGRILLRAEPDDVADPFPFTVHVGRRAVDGRSR